jgi:hypothetical protein
MLDDNAERGLLQGRKTKKLFANGQWAQFHLKSWLSGKSQLWMRKTMLNMTLLLPADEIWKTKKKSSYCKYYCVSAVYNKFYNKCFISTKPKRWSATIDSKEKEKD